MSGPQELAWDPQFDEGVRLISTHANFSGIRAQLRLPLNFVCDSPQSYFNFYLGINFRNSGGVEAGVSHTFKEDPTGGAMRPHWRMFVNPPGNPVERFLSPGELVTMELAINYPEAVLSVGTWDGLNFFGTPVTRGVASASAGYVKMVAAVQEFHGRSLQRTTRFDEMTFSALQVRKEGRTDWLNINKIQGLFWNLERPPSMHTILRCNSHSYQNFTVYTDYALRTSAAPKPKPKVETVTT